MKKLFIALTIIGCGSGDGYHPNADASSDQYQKFSSVCQLDNGMGVECSDLTPTNWAWSWYGVGEQGLETYYCNQAQCISGKQCMVQDGGKLLNGICK